MGIFYLKSLKVYKQHIYNSQFNVYNFKLYQIAHYFVKIIADI